MKTANERSGGGVLDLKEKKFVEAMMTAKTQSEAAVAAGIAKNRADAWARMALKRQHVKEAIEARHAELIRKVERKTEVTQERVLLELARIGFSDIRNIFGEGGQLKPMDEWDADAAAAVSSVKFKDGEIAEVKLWSKDGALEKIGKVLGLFAEKEDGRAGNGINPLTDLSEDEMYELLTMRRAMRARDVQPKMLER